MPLGVTKNVEKELIINVGSYSIVPETHFFIVGTTIIGKGTPKISYLVMSLFY